MRRLGKVCFNCLWYEETHLVEGDSCGECHRYPPQQSIQVAIRKDSFHGEALFQAVSGVDWCGEFKPEAGAD